MCRPLAVEEDGSTLPGFNEEANMKVSKIWVLLFGQQGLPELVAKIHFEWLSIEKGALNSYHHNKKNIGLNFNKKQN